MQVDKISLRDTKSFSDFFLDYVDDKEELRSLYGLRPEIDTFEKQIERKDFPSENRAVLCQTLTKQYEGLTQSDAVALNLSSLRESNTYTITTGHQLNVFTGPLYFIYKIATVVNTAKLLRDKFPAYKFVPVYWMASEDHDFDEIAYFNLFGKKHVWDSEEKGAVGRFSVDGLELILDELPEKVSVFEKAYREFGNLADATRYFVNELFADFGVVVVDGDHKDLKSLFKEAVREDIVSQRSNAAVQKTNERIEALGYKPQIFSREINFFYLQEQSRERIIPENGKYLVNNTDVVFSQEEILAELDASPEKFSPNVVMRPLYEETILPNLAYVGGPAEMIYWLQLKGIFDERKMAFPVLLPRNFGLYINGASTKRMNKLNLSNQDIFSSSQMLKESYLSSNAEEDGVSIEEEMRALKVLYAKLEAKSGGLNGSLKGFVAAEYSKAAKGLENLAKRLKKSEESRFETEINQLLGLKDKLFPNGGLQERHDNFLNFYINNPNFIHEVMDSLDPFDMSMHVMKS